MAHALIIITDDADGSVNVQVKFGPAGADENSAAHGLAAEVATYINEIAVTGEG